MKKGCFISVLIILGFFCFVLYKCSQDSFFKTYDKKDLTENYDKHEKEIADFVTYFKSIIPPDILVDIEINDTKNIDIFHVIKDDINYGGWDINVDSPKADTIFSILNWDKSQIIILKNKLDQINCISIDNRYPVNVGFQRSVMSKFYYTIFDTPIAQNDSLMKIYDSKCEYIYYRDNVSLQYGSGATGSLCFPKRFLEEK